MSLRYPTYVSDEDYVRWLRQGAGNPAIDPPQREPLPPFVAPGSVDVSNLPKMEAPGAWDEVARFREYTSQMPLSQSAETASGMGDFRRATDEAYGQAPTLFGGAQAGVGAGQTQPMPPMSETERAKAASMGSAPWNTAANQMQAQPWQQSDINIGETLGHTGNWIENRLTDASEAVGYPATDEERNERLRQMNVTTDSMDAIRTGQERSPTGEMLGTGGNWLGDRLTDAGNAYQDALKLEQQLKADIPERWKFINNKLSPVNATTVPEKIAYALLGEADQRVWDPQRAIWFEDTIKRDKKLEALGVEPNLRRVLVGKDIVEKFINPEGRHSSEALVNFLKTNNPDHAKQTIERAQGAFDAANGRPSGGLAYLDEIRKSPYGDSLTSAISSLVGNKIPGLNALSSIENVIHERQGNDENNQTLTKAKTAYDAANGGTSGALAFLGELGKSPYGALIADAILKQMPFSSQASAMLEKFNHLTTNDPENPIATAMQDAMKNNGGGISGGWAAWDAAGKAFDESVTDPAIKFSMTNASPADFLPWLVGGGEVFKGLNALSKTPNFVGALSKAPGGAQVATKLPGWIDDTAKLYKEYHEIEPFLPLVADMDRKPNETDDEYWKRLLLTFISAVQSKNKSMIKNQTKERIWNP